MMPDKSEMLNILKTNQVSVKYIKRDNTESTILCTLIPDLILESYHNDLNVYNNNELYMCNDALFSDTITVFDIENSVPKSFNINKQMVEYTIV